MHFLADDGGRSGESITGVLKKCYALNGYLSRGNFGEENEFGAGDGPQTLRRFVVPCRVPRVTKKCNVIMRWRERRKESWRNLQNNAILTSRKGKISWNCCFII